MPPNAPAETVSLEETQTPTYVVRFFGAHVLEYMRVVAQEEEFSSVIFTVMPAQAKTDASVAATTLLGPELSQSQLQRLRGTTERPTHRERMADYLRLHHGVLSVALVATFNPEGLDDYFKRVKELDNQAKTASRLELFNIGKPGYTPKAA